METCEAGLSEVQRVEAVNAVPYFTGLAQNLKATWNAPSVDMRCRQQLLRAHQGHRGGNDYARDVILTIHWWRPALAGTGSQDQIRRAWPGYAWGGSGDHAIHGNPVVGCRNRCHTQPHGHADRSGKGSSAVTMARTRRLPP